MAVASVRLRSTPYVRADIDSNNILSHLPRPAPVLYDSRDGPARAHDNDHSNFRRICILPTTDEILSINPVYLPKKNVIQPNPLPVGPERHLDLLFRQLRLDHIEKIKDICYAAAQILSFTQNYNTKPQSPQRFESKIQSESILPDAQHETAAGNRYFLYHNAKVEELQAHETKSILFRVSFDCPSFMKGRKIHTSGRFQKGMLLALIGFDKYTKLLSTYFLEVHAAQSTMSMDNRGGSGQRAAVQATLPLDTSDSDILELIRYAHRLCPNTRLLLVEFPKILYAGFYNCLKRLQGLTENDVAFWDCIAPQADKILNSSTSEQDANAGSRTAIQCPPPCYALDAGFEFDLNSILRSGDSGHLRMSITQLQGADALQAIRTRTTLDHGQAASFRENLLRNFAFTQGPPGTGKTYLGVQLTRVLLASRRIPKPILVVCLTNHALDSFLGDLKDAGVNSLLRMGSGSREEWTSSINIRERRRKNRFSDNELQNKAALQQTRKTIFVDLESHCQCLSDQNLTGKLGWHMIAALLSSNHPQFYAQFLSITESPYAQAFIFDYWATGGDLSNIQNLHKELTARLSDARVKDPDHVTKDVCNMIHNLSHPAKSGCSNQYGSNVWDISLAERQELLSGWRTEIDNEDQARRMLSLYKQHQELSKPIRAIYDRRDVRILLDHDVIAVTTTACASRWELFKALDVEIVICEEAGEVMEPHALCTLLPSVKHAIFIGDPLQLRPEVSEQVLSMEHNMSYRLDESLFERMMLPNDPHARAMPTSQLTIQRRMHPSIAAISRLTYPFLVDHNSTHNHLTTDGLEHRMFWWDHQVPEEKHTDVLKSHVNLHEVDMVAGLVRHLLKGSAYSQGDIAVLTPYSGQLAELNKALASTCSIWLCEKDREALLDLELLEKSDEEPQSKNVIAMSQMLRIATIDNFQGEEAKIIILSTVRSGGRPGFLQILNRINVACSRARNGFYIIGNSQTLKQVPMWNAILDVFGSHRGAKLTTCCSRHQQHRQAVQVPQDFELIRDCSEACNHLLSCGHHCTESCHSIELHERSLIPCRARCEKIFETCNHRCTKPCSVSCGRCTEIIGQKVLECGHVADTLCATPVPVCDYVIGSQTLSCGHVVDLKCRNTEASSTCQMPCATILPCGHKCMGQCGSCQSTGHQSCKLIHGGVLSCGHLCKSACHDGDCPPCDVSVEAICEHGKRARLCSDRPEPCLKLRQDNNPIFEGQKVPCFLPSFENEHDRSFKELSYFSQTFHRAVLLLYKALNRYTAELKHRESDLTKTFDLFKSGLRPNPMAATSNSRAILQRGQDILKLRSKITAYHKQTIDPLEQSMRRVSKVVDCFPTYCLLLSFHFSILELRTTNVHLLDIYRLALFLFDLEDSSNETHRIAIELLHFTRKEIVYWLQHTEHTLLATEIKTCAALEVELRLLRTQLRITLEQVHLRLSRIGILAGLELQKGIGALSEHIESIDTAIQITGMYSNVKRLSEPAISIRKRLENTGDKDFLLAAPIVSISAVDNIARLLASSKADDMTLCETKHLYSHGAFPAGCPFCCRKIMSKETTVQQQSKPLFENDFLQAMRNINPYGAAHARKPKEHTSNSEDSPEYGSERHSVKNQARYASSGKQIEPPSSLNQSLKPGDPNISKRQHFTTGDGIVGQSIAYSPTTSAESPVTPESHSTGRNVRTLSNEARFLEAMRSISINSAALPYEASGSGTAKERDSTCVEESVDRKENVESSQDGLSNEERFLEAMRKL